MNLCPVHLTPDKYTPVPTHDTRGLVGPRAGQYLFKVGEKWAKGKQIFSKKKLSEHKFIVIFPHAPFPMHRIYRGIQRIIVPEEGIKNDFVNMKHCGFGSNFWWNPRQKGRNTHKRNATVGNFQILRVANRQTRQRFSNTLQCSF